MKTKSLVTLLGLGVAIALLALWDPTGSLSSKATSSSKESSMSKVVHLTTQAFPALAAQEKPVLVDFWAPWCGPCRTQGPILETVAGQVGDQAVVAKVNVDEERGLAAQFGVEAIPTLVVMKQGKVVQRFVGVQQAPTLVQALSTAP
jgi:thioredoxin 1